ncbi:MAG: hypothetical protein RIQ28_1469, partial [Pseudomonadota bacterium]
EQRITEQDCPAHAIAELRANLAVGGNTTGIIVGGPGNQAWPQLSQA